ncbi:hypothetical protein B0H13DRAFT_1882975 [Mycena leptocephala]|nr:hypothetical protein B0H13DRAFT_1882975 [Mycena leptocephala]
MAGSVQIIAPSSPRAKVEGNRGVHPLSTLGGGDSLIVRPGTAPPTSSAAFFQASKDAHAFFFGRKWGKSIEERKKQLRDDPLIDPESVQGDRSAVHEEEAAESGASHSWGMNDSPPDVERPNPGTASVHESYIYPSSHRILELKQVYIAFGDGPPDLTEFLEILGDACPEAYADVAAQSSSSAIQSSSAPLSLGTKKAKLLQTRKIGPKLMLRSLLTSTGRHLALITPSPSRSLIIGLALNTESAFGPDIYIMPVGVWCCAAPCRESDFGSPPAHHSGIFVPPEAPTVLASSDTEPSLTLNDLPSRVKIGTWGDARLTHARTVASTVDARNVVPEDEGITNAHG